MEKPHENRFNAYRQGPNKRQNHHRPGKRLTSEDLQEIRDNHPGVWDDAADQAEYSSTTYQINNSFDTETPKSGPESENIFDLSLDELDKKRQEAFAIKAESDDFRLYNDAYVQKRSDILGQIKADKEQSPLALEYTPGNTYQPAVINQAKNEVDPLKSDLEKKSLLGNIAKSLATHAENLANKNNGDDEEPSLADRVKQAVKDNEEDKKSDLIDRVKQAIEDNNTSEDKETRLLDRVKQVVENNKNNPTEPETEQKKQSFFSKLGAFALNGYNKAKDKVNTLKNAANTFSVNLSANILAHQQMADINREKAKELKKAEEDTEDTKEKEAKRKKWRNFTIGGMVMFGLMIGGITAKEFNDHQENKSRANEPPQEQTDPALDKEVADQLTVYEKSLQGK